MAVIRVEKKRNFTVMSNHHLSSNELSLKAKGLLSMMLALPDTWDYSIRGLAKISKEGVDCIRATLKELERCGYVERNLLRGKDGKITDTEYIIYEMPPAKESVDKSEDNSPLDCPSILDEPMQNEPYTENPYTGIADTENTIQLNTNRINTKEINTDLIKYLSINQTDVINDGDNPSCAEDMLQKEIRI